MKKKPCDDTCSPEREKKQVFLTRARYVFLCVLMCFTSLSLMAQEKEKKFDVSFENESLETVLTSLKKQCGYDFIYQKEAVAGINVKSLVLKQVTLKEVLDKLLLPLGFSYEIVNRSVVIKKNGEKLKDAFVQSMTIRGKVVDMKKHPLPGVTVLVKGTVLGVSTSTDGSFKLEIPDKKDVVLVFSFVGMESKEVKLNELKDKEILTGKKDLEVILEEAVESLEDVVITGYANIRKESFTGSSVTVTKDELLKVSSQNLMKALQVFDASIKMVTNNEMGSDPNTLPEYYIRGRSGISEVTELDKLTASDVSQFALANNPSAPIFILDGFEVSQTKIYDLDINRIASVTILKDAAATAVYGARAANGVIVIETVMPQPGEILVNYSGTLVLTAPDLSSYDLLDAKEILEAERLAGYYTGKSSDQMAAGTINYAERMNAILGGVNTDWIAKPLQLQVNHKHSVFFEGGSEELRWGLNMSYNHNGGVMKESFRNVYGAGLTVDYRWKKLQIKNIVSLGVMNSQESPYGEFSGYVRMKPYLSPYDENGALMKNYKLYYNSMPPNGYTQVLNPLYEASLGSFSKDKYIDVSDHMSLNWFINPYWKLSGTFSISFNLEDIEDYTDPASGEFLKNVSDVLERGTLSDREVRSTSWNANGLLTYNRQIQLHNMNFAIGAEVAETRQEATYSYYKGFPSGDLSSPAWASEIAEKPTYKDSYSRRFGSYLQFNYSYDNIYLFDIAARLEGSTAFGAKKRTGLFWSGGVGLNIHNYHFMQNVAMINQFKISATYGQTGKANFSPYQARTTYIVLTDKDYATNMGMTLKALGNEELRWEKARTINVHTEIGLWNNLFNIQVDYYHIKTLDQVQTVSIPSSSGFTSYVGNVGETLNKGIDASVNILAYRTQDWDIYTFFKVNHNKNILTKVGEALKNYNESIDEYLGSFASNSKDVNAGKSFTKYEEGNSLTAIYGMKSLGIDPQRGDEFYVKRDGSTTHVWTSAEQQNLGDTEPKVSGACGINVRWKQFSIYTTFLYRWGGQQYNYTLQAIENVDLKSYSGDKRILTDRWKQIGDVTPLKDIADQTYVTRATSRFVQNENYIKFNSLTISYEFEPPIIKRIGMDMLRLQFNMEDIAILSTLKQERGTTYPFAHTFNLGLNLSF